MRHVKSDDVGKAVLTYWGTREEGGYKGRGVTILNGIVISVGRKFFKVLCPQKKYRTNGNQIYKVSRKRFPIFD